MQFILKDGFIFIANNEGELTSKIEADVVIKYVEDFDKRTFSYSVNGKPYKKIENEKIAITKEELDKPYIDLKIKAVHKDDIKVYKSDKIAVTHAIRFGDAIEDAYPERIKALEKRLDRTHKLIEETVGYVEEVEKRGRLL